jgi:hypothetical protein
MTKILHRDPDRRCKKLDEWPAVDRDLWQAALIPGDLFEEGGSRGTSLSAGALLAGLGVFDHIGKIVVSGIERLHFGGAVVALVARRDAFLVAAQRVDDLGDGRRSAIGEMAAIGLVGIRGGQQR